MMTKQLWGCGFAVLLSFFIAGGAFGGLAEGIAAYDRDDNDTAYRELAPLAAAGNEQAQERVAYMHMYGAGTPQNFKEAMRLNRLAAAKGNAKAQYRVGLMYIEGMGVTVDVREGLKWATRSAAQNYDSAQTTVGLIYLRGAPDVPKDLLQASKWLRLAAAQEEPTAMLELSESYFLGEGVKQDSAEAQRLLIRAANKGHAAAQAALAMRLLDGAFMIRNPEEAYRWSSASAKQGNFLGQRVLGLMYANGDGAPQDSTEAMKWLRLSADQGDGAAWMAIGLHYANALGVKRNLVVAHAIFTVLDNPASKEALRGIVHEMSPAELEAAKALNAAIVKPGNGLKALDDYVSRS